MRRRKQTIPMPMPVLGVDLDTPSPMVDRRATPYAFNTRYDHGYIGPRSGSEQIGHSGSGTEMPFGTASELVLLLDNFINTDGTAILVAVTNKDLYDYDGSSDVWDFPDNGAGLTAKLSGDVTLLNSSCHVADDGVGAHAADYFFAFNNQVDAAMVWDGSAADPAFIIADWWATQIFAYKSSLVWLCPREGSGSKDLNKILWTASGTIDNVATLNSGFFFMYDTPGTIVWSALLGDYRAIYKTDSIALMRYTGGTTLFTYDTIVHDTGLLTPGLLAVLEGEHIFFSKHEVHRWGGQAVPVNIGKRIIKDFYDNINWNALGACRNYVDKENGQVKFFIPTGTNSYADRVYIYDYLEDWWAIDTLGHYVTAAGTYTSYSSDTWGGIPDDTDHEWGDYGDTTWADFGTNLGRDVPVLGTETGYTYQTSIATKSDPGNVAIDQIHETPDFAPSQQEYQGRRTRYYAFEFEAKGNSVDAWYSVDEGDTWTQIGSSQTLTSDWTYYQLYFNTSARKLRVRLRNNTAGSNFYCRWMGVRVQPAGRGS